MMESNRPTTWQDLERAVARLLLEAGYLVKRQQTIRLVRGTSKVDVVATDESTTPKRVVLIECKHWKSRITKEKVHAFRTVVTDAGVEAGWLLGSKGFQSGAYQAAAFSNVRLLDWNEFQELIEDRWTDQYLRPSLRSAFEPLVDLTEPLSSKLIRELGDLNAKQSRPAIALSEKYQVFAFFGLELYADYLRILPSRQFAHGKIALPLRVVGNPKLIAELPASVVDLSSARDFGVAMISAAQTAVAEIESAIKECHAKAKTSEQSRR
jgi:Holliday junction resolvase